MNKITIVLDTDTEDEFRSVTPGYTLDNVKIIAIEAIAQYINLRKSAEQAEIQAKERVELAEKLQSNTKKRIMVLGELNQIRE